MLAKLLLLTIFLPASLVGARPSLTSYSRIRYAYYLDFEAETNVPITLTSIRSKELALRSAAIRALQSQVACVFRQRLRGSFSGKHVRLLFVTEAGNVVAVDNKGGVLKDGHSYKLTGECMRSLRQALSDSGGS